MSQYKFKLCILFVFVLLSQPFGLVAAQEVGLEQTRDDFSSVYTLSPYDQIKLAIYGEDSLSGIYTLDSNAVLSIPLAGNIDLRDQTISDARATIEETLSAGYLISPSVSIEITKYKPFYILGEVRAPGQYDFNPGMSVLNAVAVAGGFTYRAKQKTVEIQRKNRQTPDMQLYPLDSDIYPGDTIIVKERFF
jgi:polysaccharide export outer membrane protein